MQRWSQTLIDGAGNFGWTPGPFDATDIANAEMDKCIAHASNQFSQMSSIGAAACY
jgi:hypothetical protein